MPVDTNLATLLQRNFRFQTKRGGARRQTALYDVAAPADDAADAFQASYSAAANQNAQIKTFFVIFLTFSALNGQSKRFYKDSSLFIRCLPASLSLSLRHQ